MKSMMEVELNCDVLIPIHFMNQFRLLLIMKILYSISNFHHYAGDMNFLHSGISMIEIFL